MQLTNDLAMQLTPIDRIGRVRIHLLETLAEYLSIPFRDWNLLSSNGDPIPERQDVL